MGSTATIALSIDPATGRRTVTIRYTSDLDALPHEHEEAHRELVDELLDGGIAKPGDTIVVEREGSDQKVDVVEGEPAPEPGAARQGG